MIMAYSADSHLGYAQYNLRDRATDYITAVRHVFQRSADLNVELLVLAGDIFDAVKPPADAVKAMRDIVFEFRDRYIVAGIDGNHDSANNNWLKVCGIVPLTATPLVVNGVRVLGLNAMRPQLFRQRLNELQSPADVLVIHQAIQELANAPFAELSALELLPALQGLGIRCVCMGDIHDSNERLLGGIEFLYSGSSELTELSERHDKSFWVITIDDKNVALRQEPISTRPVIEYQLKTQDDCDKLLAGINAAPHALAVLRYWPDISRDARHRIETMLRAHGAMFVVRPITVAGDTITAVADRTYDRRGVMVRQQEAIKAVFPENSDGFTLTSRLLLRPDDVDAIVTEYLTAKGVA